MLFLRTLFFHLLFILHGLPLIFAHFGGPPSDTVYIKGLEPYKYQRWIRKGKGGSPNDIIYMHGGSGFITFHVLQNPGGYDTYLTERNKKSILDTWAPMPEMARLIPLEKRLQTLTFSLGEGGIITHHVWTPQGLPTLSEYSPFPTAHQTDSLGLRELEGDWYRVLAGPKEYGGNPNDAIRIGKGRQLRGWLTGASYSVEWNDYAERGRLLGGWRSYPKIGGNDKLLLISVVKEELNYKFAPPEGPYTGPWIPISTGKLPEHVSSPPRHFKPSQSPPPQSPPPLPPRPNTPPQKQGWRGTLSSMFLQQHR